MTRTSDLRGFLYIAAGQILSMLGSVLSQFALGVWVYTETGSVTRFAIIALSISVPVIVLSPIAGSLVDRWNLRTTLIASDSIAAAATLAIALLFWTGNLHTWHIYTSSIVSSAARSLQVPAFTATSTILLPREHYARGSGLMQLGEAAAHILAPLAAGFLLSIVDIGGVLLVDVITFALALIPLLFVSIPARDRQAHQKSAFVHEMMEGIRYVVSRSGFVALLGIAAIINLCLGLAELLITPMVLAMAGTRALGTVVSLAGLGMLAGSALIMVWGGPRRRSRGIIGFTALFGASLIAAGARPAIELIAFGAFAAFLWIPLINGCSQALWQAKVPLPLQGRVTSVRVMIAYSTLPIAQLAAGPLADDVFEPLMTSSSSATAEWLGHFMGHGPGRGIALVFVLAGFACVLASMAGALWRPLRRLDDLPDAPAQNE